MVIITISEQNYQRLRQKAQAISLSPDIMVDKLKIQTILSQPVDLLLLAGVGAEVWTNINVNDYINQGRDSWQR